MTYVTAPAWYQDGGAAIAQQLLAAQGMWVLMSFSLSGWKSVQEQMLMWLVLADEHDADTSAQGLEALSGLVSLLRTCRTPFKLSSNHVSLTGQHTCPLPDLCCGRASVQGCCRHLTVALSPTFSGKPPSREEWYCLQSLFSYRSYQTNIFFPPKFNGLLAAANCIFGDTYSAVNRLSNSAELVFIIPDVSVAAMCAFAAGISAWWLGYRLVVIKLLKKQEAM